ncbi:MAG: integrase family protein [bacterium]|nr:integrase family protein [bacterium]
MPAKKKKTNLTAKRINAIKTPKTGQSITWDAEVQGLGVRVTAGGAKSFIIERWFEGSCLRRTIGATANWKLDDVRQEARRLHRLMDQGVKPPTTGGGSAKTKVSEVWSEYLAAHVHRWGDRHMRDNRYLARAPRDDKPGGILWPLLQKKLGDVDADTLIKWAKGALNAPSKSKNSRGRHTALRQGLMRFRALWRWAYERNEYQDVMNPPEMFSHSDLKALKPKVHPRHDVLEKEQLASWFGAVGKIKNPAISAYLQILLLTGARRNELSKLKWADVDFQWKSIHLHDKIEADGRTIPLTPYVEHLITRLSENNEWVFSSTRSEGGHIIEPRIAHKRALADACLSPNLSIHGLRRSFSTLSEWIEMPSGITAQIMGHKPSATAEKHYKERPLGLLAQWHRKLEVWMLSEGGIDFDAEAAATGIRVVK